MPIMQLSLSGEQDLVSLKKLADKIVKEHLERIDGVASVSVTGGRERAHVVEPNPYPAPGLRIVFH